MLRTADTCQVGKSLHPDIKSYFDIGAVLTNRTERPEHLGKSPFNIATWFFINKYVAVYS